jgi:Flp pilus assembly protein TadD
MSRGELEPAAEAFREALNHDERDYRVWSNLAAVLYLTAGREAEAREVCRTAVRLAERELESTPSDAETFAKLSWLESRCGDAAGARRAVDRALSLDREDASILVAVAGTLAGIGDGERACEILREAADRGASLDVVRRDPALADLEGLACFQELVAR